MIKRGCRGADTELKAARHRPVLVTAIEDACGKCVARTCQPGNGGGGNIHAGLPDDAAVRAAGARALGEMDQCPFTQAKPDERPGGLFDRAAVERRASPQRQAGELLGLEVIGEQHIHGGQHRGDDRVKTVAVVADAVE